MSKHRRRTPAKRIADRIARQHAVAAQRSRWEALRQRFWGRLTRDAGPTS